MVATNNVHYATPARRPLADRPGRRPGPAAAGRARRLAPLRRHRPSALGRRAGAPLRPVARRGRTGPPSSGGRAPSTCTWWRRASPTSRCPPGTPSRAGWWSWCGAGRQRPLRPARQASACPGAWAQIDHELEVIGTLGYAGYFLIVWDIVEFCRRQRHLLPGPGLGRQLRRLLRPRHHPRRRRGPRAVVRALPLSRARRPTRHRHRHRVGPARGGHRLRLRALRPPVRGPGRQRHHLPRPLRHPRRGQGPRARPRGGGRVGQGRRPR